MNRLSASIILFCALGALAVFVFPATPASADIVTGLIDRWTLDETNGTIAHDSVGGNDATLFNFTDNPWLPGKVGGSLNFSNLSNYAITKSPISYNQYTVDFWLKVNGPGGIDPRLVFPKDGYESWDVISSFFNKGVGFYYNSGANLVQDPNPPVTGVWENYATTIDLTHSTAAVYRNGVQVAAGTFSDNVPQLDWMFGHNQDFNNTNDTLNGQLDDIRIYNRILSVSDIRQLPEPSTFVLGLLGLLGLFAVARRRKVAV